MLPPAQGMVAPGHGPRRRAGRLRCGRACRSRVRGLPGDHWRRAGDPGWSGACLRDLRLTLRPPAGSGRSPRWLPLYAPGVVGAVTGHASMRGDDGRLGDAGWSLEVRPGLLAYGAVVQGRRPLLRLVRPGFPAPAVDGVEHIAGTQVLGTRMGLIHFPRLVAESLLHHERDVLKRWHCSFEDVEVHRVAEDFWTRRGGDLETPRSGTWRARESIRPAG